MDEFSYIAMMGRIDTAKTLKAKEVIARELTSALESRVHYSALKDRNLMPEVLRLFKCFTKVLALHTSTLPNFIYAKERDVMRMIINGINTGNRSMTYAEFVDTFQYVDLVHIDAHYPPDFKNIINLVGDNTLPFKLHYNMYPSYSYSSMFNDIRDVGDLPLILEVEALKRTLSPEIQYTIIEDFLTEAYSEAKSVDEMIPSMQNFLTDVQTSMNTMTDRLNG